MTMLDCIGFTAAEPPDRLLRCAGQAVFMIDRSTCKYQSIANHTFDKEYPHVDYAAILKFPSVRHKAGSKEANRHDKIE